MQKWVAFDLGGVVVDVDKSVLCGLDDAFFTGTDHDDLSVGAIDAPTFIARVAGRAGRNIVEIEAMWRAVVCFRAGGAELMLSTAKRCPIAVWSNTDPVHWSTLAQRGAFLNATLSPSFLIGAMKPSPLFFQRALAAAGADEVLFLDDRRENVEAACAFGVDAVVVDGVASAAAVINRFLSSTAPPSTRRQ
jgi:hypothetical protein